MPIPDLSDASVGNEEPLEVPNTTANLPEPLRLPVSTVLVSRLKSPNAQRIKRNVRVKFNAMVYVDGEDQPLPLNCILDEDNSVNLYRRPAPAVPNTEEIIPPAPPPRLASQFITAPSSEAMASHLEASPVQILRYENMDMFMKSIQQFSVSGKK